MKTASHRSQGRRCTGDNQEDVVLRQRRSNLESREPGINLSGSWQPRHSTAYNTPLRKQSRLQGIPPGQSPHLNRGQGTRRTRTPSHSPDARQRNAREGGPTYPRWTATDRGANVVAFRSGCRLRGVQP